MDVHFDSYAFSDTSSAPRTPSPDDIHYSRPMVYDADPNSHWNTNPTIVHDIYKDPHSQYTDYPEPTAWHDVDEQQVHHQHHPHHHQQQQHHQQHAPAHLPRRATFPYVRHDSREDIVQVSSYPSPYGMNEQLVHPFVQQQQQHQQHHQSPHRANYYPSPQLPLTSSPPAPYLSPPSSNVKLEDHHSHMMNQTPFYLGSTGFMPPHHPQHSGIPIQHTDDAASKETQYLRRRCFNCHTTEPPSWRRSTLNPGKIVCNKCGLYERTHLRPRPLRFDELRAGNKARKQSLSNGSKTGSIVKNSKPNSPTSVKKEPGDLNSIRARSSSVSSSSGANSDWDESVSVSSFGSAPPTSFNSPALSPFPMPRASASPRAESGSIRLPNAGLNDLTSITSTSSPEASGTAATADSPSTLIPTTVEQIACPPSSHQFYRRDSMPELRASLDVQVTS